MNILLNATHMKITGFVIPALITVLISVSSCFYDSEEYLYPQTGNQCDTTRLLMPYRLSRSSRIIVCHVIVTVPLPIMEVMLKLEDYPDIKVHADAGTLFGTISHENGLYTNAIEFFKTG